MLSFWGVDEGRPALQHCCTGDRRQTSSYLWIDFESSVLYACYLDVMQTYHVGVLNGTGLFCLFNTIFFKQCMFW